jgi:hypothetical protein
VSSMVLFPKFSFTWLKLIDFKGNPPAIRHVGMQYIRGLFCSPIFIETMDCVVPVFLYISNVVANMRMSIPYQEPALSRQKTPVAMRLLGLSNIKDPRRNKFFVGTLASVVGLEPTRYCYQWILSR